MVLLSEWLLTAFPLGFQSARNGFKPSLTGEGLGKAG
jgi:hypothetical protein